MSSARSPLLEGLPQMKCEKVGKRSEELVKEVTEGTDKEAMSGKGDPTQESVDIGRNLLRLLSQQSHTASSKQSQEEPSESVQDFSAAVVSSEAGQAQAQGPSAFTSAPAPALFSGQQSAAPGPGPAPVPITAMPIQQVNIVILHFLGRGVGVLILHST